MGDGTFSEPPIEFAVDESGFTPKPRFVKTADMDDDGLTDVVTSNASSHRIGVLISALQGGGP